MLLESEEQECPNCHNKPVSPDTLIPNRFLRSAVTKFRSETGYTKAVPQVQTTPTSVPLTVSESESSIPAEEQNAFVPDIDDDVDDDDDGGDESEDREIEEPELILEVVC